MNKLIKKIKKVKPKILVLGDVMLDHYISGKVSKISPEAPVPILEYISEKKVLGGAGNVAHNLINLGAQVSIATVVGSDLDGDVIQKLFKDIKVSIENVISSKGYKTTIKTRFLAEKVQLLRLDNDSPSLKKKELDRLIKISKYFLQGFDCLIISDYDKGVCEEKVLKSFINEAIKIKIPVFVDPKGDSWGKYINATCITPNSNEVETKLKSILKNDFDFEAAAKNISEKLNLESCLITRGANGMTYYDKNGVIHKRVLKKRVFDVSGAGDTVIASLAVAYLAKLGLNHCLDFASKTSSEVVTWAGTKPFDFSMLDSN